MQQHYACTLGERNRAFYLAKFENFDRRGGGLVASWNWPAFLFTGAWLLYRKMYVLFLVLAVGNTIAIIAARAGYPLSSLLITLALYISLGIFANSIYYANIKKSILLAKVMVADEATRLDYLRYRGGVNTWVLWVAVVVSLAGVIGVIAAIAIPAYQDYANKERLADYSGAMIATPGSAPNHTETVQVQQQPEITKNLPPAAKPADMQDINSLRSGESPDDCFARINREKPWCAKLSSDHQDPNCMCNLGPLEEPEQQTNTVLPTNNSPASVSQMPNPAHASHTAKINGVSTDAMQNNGQSNAVHFLPKDQWQPGDYVPAAQPTPADNSTSTTAGDADVDAAIDKIPELAYWREHDISKWNRAASIDKQLRARPEYQKVPLGVRFRTVVEMIKAQDQR